MKTRIALLAVLGIAGVVWLLRGAPNPFMNRLGAASASVETDYKTEHDWAVREIASDVSEMAGNRKVSDAPVVAEGLPWHPDTFAAFAAREVFVSHMGIVYSVGDDMEETGDLEAAMLADTYPDGRPVWTPVVAISLLVWFVLAMQCMSTLAVVKRETGFWAWPVYMMLYMNGLAYVVALAVYQIGTRIG